MTQSTAFSQFLPLGRGYDSSNSRGESYRQQRITINHNDSPWTEAIVKQLEKIVRLQSNWDGYGAEPIPYATTVFCLSVVERLSRNDTPPPALVPSADGGIQLEWHNGDMHIELLISEPLKAFGWASIQGTDDDREADFRQDFSTVSDWLDDFAQAVRAAA
jgi:hypothetical protein